MQLSDVAQLIKLLDKSSLTEIQFSDENSKVVLKKELPPVMPMAPIGLPATGYALPVPSAAPMSTVAAPSVADASVAPSASASSASSSKNKELTSPMVGTFYASSSPGNPPFVSVGDSVKPGQVICIIEAMKIMNEIECDVAGVVEEICVSNETPVEYGTVLFRIRPA